MGFFSFNGKEVNRSFTLPNALSVARGLGGVAFGVGLVTSKLSPRQAFVATGILVASDMEGSLITATAKWPALQQQLKIWPSDIGRKLDPLADKLFGFTSFLGGTISGEVPLRHGLPIMANELFMGNVTLYKQLKGREPQTTLVGTLVMVARCGVLLADMAANATQGPLEGRLQKTADALAIVAVGGGAISSYRASKL